MHISVGFWIVPLLAVVRAADGDDCVYNDLHGFCVTADAQKHNQQCRDLHGWLQFYRGDPWPRVYIGCGDDGVVLIHSDVFIAHV